MTFGQAVFLSCAALAVLPAFAMLIVRNVVHMAFLLLGSLCGFAGLYLLLGAAFLGFVQLLVYVGGILVLFLFGVLLTARDVVPVRRPAPAVVVLPPLLGGAALLAVTAYLALGVPWRSFQETGPKAIETVELGDRLLTAYVLPFEAVSVLLLVAMVGATYLARREPRRPREEESARR